MKGRRRIGFLIFDGITALDLIGPMDAFGTATNERGEKLYELVTLGLTLKEVVAESGLVLRPTETLAKCHDLDTFVIPGGRGLRDPAISSVISSWLTRRSNDIRRIASVCTGIYGVAPSGLLDGRSVTTHWRFAEDVQKRFPLLKVNAHCIFIRDEKFYTSAGITAGIDLALALIEQDCGRSVALNVARELIVFLKRPGGQGQYSEPLRLQVDSTDRIGDLAAWIEGNIDKDLSVPVLARRACLSERQFARRFKIIFGKTPAAYVEQARLEHARRHLCESSLTVDRIARATGFSSDDAFRRCFERNFSVSPKAYRATFGDTHTPS
jgi:transcriptional regulator GlxA family with amidase domain